MKNKSIGLRFFLNNYVYAHNPFNNIIKFSEKRNTYRTPSHTWQCLCVFIATCLLKISWEGLMGQVLVHCDFLFVKFLNCKYHKSLYWGIIFGSIEITDQEKASFHTLQRFSWWLSLCFYLCDYKFFLWII